MYVYVVVYLVSIDYIGEINFSLGFWCLLILKNYKTLAKEHINVLLKLVEKSKDCGLTYILSGGYNCNPFDDICFSR